LSDEDWRTVLLLAQVFSDGIVQLEFRQPITALLEACVRVGLQIAFERESIRDDLHRLYGTEGVVRITLHKPPGARGPISGVSFEGKAFPEDLGRRPKGS
jgi:hypothetical protein